MSKITAKEVHLNFTLAQGNFIMEALAERPFKEVFELIGHLNQQALKAFAANSDEEATGYFELTAAQVRLILETLGEMPFNRVHRLLQNMHQQIQASLDPQSQRPSETRPRST